MYSHRCTAIRKPSDSDCNGFTGRVILGCRRADGIYSHKFSAIQDVVKCVSYTDNRHLSKEDLALSYTKIKNQFTEQNEWLAIVPIASFICVVNFVKVMIMVKKWFDVRSTALTINASVSKVFQKTSSGYLTFLLQSQEKL